MTAPLTDQLDLLIKRWMPQAVAGDPKAAALVGRLIERSAQVHGLIGGTR